MSAYKGTNGFTSCATCGALGHEDMECPLRELYHRQAVIQLVRGDRTPEVLREVYGANLDRTEASQC